MGAREQIEADPYLAPNWSSAALITIDTQCDTLDDGALEIPGTSAALPAMTRLTEAFRAAGRPIVHVVRVYERDGANVDACRRAAVEAGVRMLAPGEAGTELAPGLAPGDAPALDPATLLAGEPQPLAAGEWALYKPRWGAFYGTRLEEHLRGEGVDTLVFCGCNFPNCPRTSIYEASERDFRVVVVSDALSGLYERGERELGGIGALLLETGTVLAAIGPARPASATGGTGAR
jgi:nicotinamidase-related amidase